MTTPTITGYLKCANLQMAAEAFLVSPDGSIKGDIPTALREGNLHASKFTETEATKFADEWQVVAQKPNTTTGFSGTLFRNRLTNELVISFRSTEFIDDAAELKGSESFDFPGSKVSEKYPANPPSAF